MTEDDEVVLNVLLLNDVDLPTALAATDSSDRPTNGAPGRLSATVIMVFVAFCLLVLGLAR